MPGPDVQYLASKTATVTGLEPRNGTAYGGTRVTLEGTGFVAGAEVTSCILAKFENAFEKLREKSK